MSRIISATTRSAPGGRSRDRYLFAAGVVLEQARDHLREGEMGLALEYAYRAALRTAGARIAASGVLARRRRVPSSAWDKLVLIDEAGARRAQEFRGYSAVRSRVSSGIERDPEPAMVQELIVRTKNFLAEAEAEAGWYAITPDVA